MAKNGEVRITVDHSQHSHSKPVNVPPTVADDKTQTLPVVLQIKLQELQATRDSLKSTDPPDQAGKPKIRKVPFLLRDHINFKKYYVPRVVSLGPIHHGQPEYKLAEEYKLRLTLTFVGASGKSEATLLERVLRDIEELKKCFDEEVISPPYDDNEKLTWMLFVDGCAVLQAIHGTVGGSLGALKMKNDLMVFALQDLFLLENQLPYRLLELLMNESAEKEKLKASIKAFIAIVVKHKPPDSTDGETPHHLLDLLRKSFLGSPSKTPAAPTPNATTAAQATAATAVPKTAAPIATHDENGKTKASDNRNKGSNIEHDQQYTFRNVQELKAAGIHVKHDSKKGDLLTDIHFKKWYFFAARLYLPRITVDDSTGPKFLNLIAYEMCPDFDNDFRVTSYISFLDSLIDYPNDVTELRKASILHNHLGSDQEVAQLFNEIGTDLVPDRAAYEDVKKEIQKFYKTKWKTWIAEVFHVHFSSPWTITAFLAALLGLGLTGLQTWYSVKPS